MYSPTEEKMLEVSKQLMQVYYVGNLLEYHKWIKEIPFIPISDKYEIQPTPSFGGAIVRFRVREIGRTEDVSVYLDCYNLLGLYSQPYWEIYPNAKGDVSRYPMNNIDELKEGILESLTKYNKEINKTNIKEIN